MTTTASESESGGRLKQDRKKRDQLKIEVIVVTPEIAIAWLEKNTSNRTISEITVRRYMRTMMCQRWRLTGDAIRFDRQGRLIDGQHRLTACVRANTPFESLVVYGLDPEDQDVIDTNRPRRPADALALRGITNAGRVSAALRLLIIYRAGFTSFRNELISNDEIVAAYERHQSITKSVTASHHMPKASPLAMIALTHYFATHFLDADEHATAMLNVFRSGIPHYDGDPIHALRERLIKKIGEESTIRGEVSAWTLAYAWNLFVKSRPVSGLRWQKTAVDIDGLNRNLL